MAENGLFDLEVTHCGLWQLTRLSQLQSCSGMYWLLSYVSTSGLKIILVLNSAYCFVLGGRLALTQ